MKKVFYISGMHCVSCEMLIEDELKNIFKESKINISHKRAELKIEADEISEKKVKEIVKACGYRVIDEKEKILNLKKKFKVKDFFELALAFVFLFLILYLFSKFELSKFFPEINDKVGLLLALGLGIIASLSTCLAITGGIVMSFSSNYKLDKNSGEKKRNSFLARSLPQVYFHFGRIAGFFILGGLLGALGEKIQYSSAFAGFLTILVALIMFYIALHILGFTPNISKLGFYLPKKWSKRILSLKGSKSPYLISIIGVLSFFLPCGFTQSMQLAAVASGSFIKGALIMSFFAIGTLPVLFSVGLGSSYAQNKKMGFLKKLIAAVIIFFALYSLNSSLAISGSKYSLDFWSQLASTTNKKERGDEDKRVLINKDGHQTVQLDIDYSFKQKEFRVKKDVPVKFIVNAIHVNGCTNEVVISRLGLTSGKLKNGSQGLIEFTPTQTGILPFSCWMGMVNGRFIVE